MYRSIYCQAPKLLACLTVFSVLVFTLSVSAQSEGIEIEHSPNAKRLLRLHEAKLADLAAFYVESIGHPTKRFEQTCERHIKRYMMLLEREVQTLTRQGLIDEAKEVQAVIQRAEAWTITPPDENGLHFLSKVDLEVPGSEKANKYGVDLLSNVQKAGELFNKQAAKSFDQYKAKVIAARESLQNEMTQILEQEQRAGRLDAVREVQATIASLKNLQDVPRPKLPSRAEEADARDGRDRDEGDQPAVDIPDSIVGFYVMNYVIANTLSRETVIELRNDGASVRAQYYYGKDRKTLEWKQDQKPVKVVLKDNAMGWKFEDASGRDIIVEMTMADSRKGYLYVKSADDWWYSDGDGGLVGPGICSIRRIGYPSDINKKFEEGKYSLDLDLSRGPKGNKVEGKMKFRLEYTSGTFFIAERTPLNELDKLEPCLPIVFHLYSQGSDIIWKAYTGIANQEEFFLLRTNRDGSKEIHFWWDEADYRDGQSPDAYGTLSSIDN